MKDFCKFIVSVCKCLRLFAPLPPTQMSKLMITLIYFTQNILREDAKNTLRGGRAHNTAVFGRKYVLPHFLSPKYMYILPQFFLCLSILPPFFCFSKYPRPIHILISSTLPSELSPYVCDLPHFKDCNP